MHKLGMKLLPLAVCLLGGGAWAQDSSRVLREPPRLPPVPQKEGRRSDRELRYDLHLREVKEGLIYNPSTDRKDKVSLRAYVSSDEKTPIDPETYRFIAPTIDMKPGQTVRVTLHNNLPEEKTDCTNHQNKPNCFNSTNLHVHGLWVSPSGNSDNVLLEIKPKGKFQYEYNVPEDHPAGTYWYHPHVHGSTAVQVGSGMAGALIIRGERPPIVSQKGEVQAPGDIDTLLKPFEPKPVEPKPFEPKRESFDYPEVLLFQQIPYACFGKDEHGKVGIKKAKNPIDWNSPGRWVCDETDTGSLSDFKNQIGAGTWRASGRYTSINGVVQPRLEMQTDRLYRWRMIDAAIHESIALRITRLDDSVAWPKNMQPQEEAKLVEESCRKGQVVNQFEVATDGLTRKEMVKRDKVVLEPGYRSDVLFAFPSAGTYCLYDEATRTTLIPSEASKPEGPRLLGKVIVSGSKVFSGEKEEQAFLLKKLKKAAEQAFTGPVLKKVVSDLEDGLKTTAFVPHTPFSSQELKTMSEECDAPVKEGQQKPECVKFYVGKQDRDDANSPVVFQINGKSFGEGQPRVLQLDNAQKWVLTSEVGNHPFHIHVNPFQVLQVLKKDPEDVTGTKYNEINYASDDAYNGLKGTWKDTVLVKQDHKVIIATRYRRYIGDFVFHCHLLDHEDQGMMEVVRIVHSDPDGKPASSTHEHHLRAHDRP